MEKKWSCAEDILCGINTPKDRENLTDFEKKHLPVLEAPERVKKDEPFTVKVTVGKLLAHPNEPAHFIEWVELYCGDTYLGRAAFSAGMTYPRPYLRLSSPMPWAPLPEKCNLHGLWEETRPIVVE